MYGLIMAPAILLFFFILSLAIANVSILHSLDQSRTTAFISTGLCIGYMTGSAAPGMEQCLYSILEENTHMSWWCRNNGGAFRVNMVHLHDQNIRHVCDHIFNLNLGWPHGHDAYHMVVGACPLLARM
jgi:hypothetical protein